MTYLIKNSISDIKRYKLTFIINLLFVSFIVFLLSFTIYIAINVFNVERMFLNKTQIILFLKQEANLNEFINTIQVNEDIKSIDVIDKDYLNKIILKSFDSNDLVTANINEIKILRVYVSYNNVEKVIAFLNSKQGIDELIFNNLFLDNMFKLLSILKNSSLIICLFLLVISFILFYYTYRLFAYERVREIQILSYLGASKIFIIAPYILSSFFIGLLGSLLGIFYYFSFVNLVSLSIKSFLGTWVSNISIYGLNNFQLIFITASIILIVVLSSFISLIKVINKDA